MTNQMEGNTMDELVIEDAEACQLAAELAELTGDSLHFAVMTALREERDRVIARRQRHERIMAITREIALSAA
ncbi:MAG: type II toxin-antitoxin system VapB family antitoxin [Acetobacteraceae bacterium]